MIRLDEFLELPQPGWPGRRLAIARQLLLMLGEGLLFVICLIVMSGLIVMLAAATDSLPAR